MAENLTHRKKQTQQQPLRDDYSWGIEKKDLAELVSIQ